MEVCDKYLHELIKINPTLNDLFLFDEYLHLKHILPIIYSENHYEKLYKLDVKYEKILKNKRNINLYDDTHVHQLKSGNHIPDFISKSEDNEFCEEIDGGIEFTMDAPPEEGSSSESEEIDLDEI